MLASLGALDDHAFAGVVDGASPSLTRFDPSTGDANLSDAWIDDRAKFVAWRALREDADAGRHAGATWRFVDRTLGDAATIVVGDGEGEPDQVAFARDGGDAIVGGTGVDRLHGGTGDDTLDGSGGSDLVEGGRGDDSLVGGDGGDRLDGGSGDDTLDGGRGDDRLAGGSGHDTYAFAAGDGADVIVDADGDGVIVVDGATLAGNEAGVAYSTEDDGVGGTTLVIRAGGPEGAAAGEIRVRDWRDGALGIHLAPVADAAGLPPWRRGQAARQRRGSRARTATSGIVVTGAAWRASPAGSRSGDTLGVAGRDVRGRGFARENGNESGSWAIAADASSGGGMARIVGRVEDRGQALDAADWTRVLRGAPALAPGGEIAAPPALDAGAVTAADVASALADAAGEHDDGDAALDTPRWPWSFAHDAHAILEPPGVAPRRGG